MVLYVFYNSYALISFDLILTVLKKMKFLKLIFGMGAKGHWWIYEMIGNRTNYYGNNWK